MKARLPQGMGGGPQNINSMLKQAQKMQEDMAALEEELGAREHEVSAGGGAVRLTINGKREIVSLEIEPEIVDPDDIETLSDILIAAFNEGQKKVGEVHDEEMAKITGALNLPGMPGLF